MAIQTVQPYGDQIQMTIDGHHVTISFTQEENPTLSALVRNTLLDAYIRKNDLSVEEQFAYNKNLVSLRAGRSLKLRPAFYFRQAGAWAKSLLLKRDFTGSEAVSLLLIFRGFDSYST